MSTNVSSTPAQPLSELVALTQIAWWEAADTKQQATQLLERFAQADAIGWLLNNLLHDDTLMGLSERLKSLDKLVLFNHADTKTRLRLHLFKAGHYDLLHNHRWPFLSIVLRGALKQRIYAGLQAHEAAFECQHRRGDVYYLGPDIYHSLSADEGTVTLVLRGPDVLTQAGWRDLGNNSSWQHQGGKMDSRKTDFSAQMLRSVVEHYLSGSA
jgi:hypothetical protein